LIRKDGSVKPAYEELMKLIKGEWWTSPVKAVTDGNGQVSFHGFLGEYKLTCQGQQTSFTVTKEDAPAIRLNP
jgi:hypothetical protein